MSSSCFVGRFWTPLLRRVYLCFLLILFGFESFQFVQRSHWNKDRLYRKLVTGPRSHQIIAVRQLVGLGAQEELIQALKAGSGYARGLAAQGLWNIWLHAAGDEPFRCTEAANAAVNSRDYAKALIILNRLVKDYPDFAEGWNGRATLFWLLGQYELSVFDCEKAVALNPNQFQAWQGMGFSQLQLRDFRGATRSLRTALRINPHDRQAQDLLRFSETILKRLNRPSGPEMLRM